MTCDRGADDYCGLLKLRFGPFDECHGIVAFMSYYNNCVFDTCEAAQGDIEMATKTLYLVSIVAY